MGQFMATLARTYWFDVIIYIGAVLSQEDVCDLFKVIVNDAMERLKFSGLEQCFPLFLIFFISSKLISSIDSCRFQLPFARTRHSLKWFVCP